MKVVGAAIIAAITLIGGWYLGKDWWSKPITFTRLLAVIIGMSLIHLCYFVSVIARSRRPMLRVGDLRPAEDKERVDSFFQMRIENLGPGSVRPVVNVTYLRDGNGKFLPIAPAFLAQEIHWRYFNDAEHHKYLQEREEAYAGVFWVREIDSDSPQILLYPVTLKPYPLWNQSIKLKEQTGLRVKIAVRCRAKDISERQEPRVIKRSYIIKPDESQSLKYKAKRVRVKSLFWRD